MFNHPSPQRARDGSDDAGALLRAGVELTVGAAADEDEYDTSDDDVLSVELSDERDDSDEPVDATTSPEPVATEPEDVATAPEAVVPDPVHAGRIFQRHPPVHVPSSSSQIGSVQYRPQYGWDDILSPPSHSSPAARLSTPSPHRTRRHSVVHSEPIPLYPPLSHSSPSFSVPLPQTPAT